MEVRRLAVMGALGCVIAAAWGYLLLGAGVTPQMPDMPDMTDMAWSGGHALVVFTMWAVMMAAMMLPGAASAIAARGAVFGVGYIIVWAGFGAGATVLQWGLERAGALSAAMGLRSAPLAALVVACIGIYQLTPLKSACLRYCCSEAGMSVHGVGAGIRATIARGMQHGLYCVGCCWALMMLLFVGGVMNLVWAAAVTFFVLAERMLPRHLVLVRAAGVALILFGTVARLGSAS